MGYNTLSFVGANRPIENLHQYLAKDKKWMEFPTMGPNGEWSKWYDMDDTMNSLSKDFPNVIFICMWIGEDYEDNGYLITHNGRSMSFKIGSNKVRERVKEIEDLEAEQAKLEQEDNDDDTAANEMGSKVDDMWDELEELRKEILQSYMSKLQFIDISKAFDFSEGE